MGRLGWMVCNFGKLDCKGLEVPGFLWEYLMVTCSWRRPLLASDFYSKLSKSEFPGGASILRSFVSLAALSIASCFLMTCRRGGPSAGSHTYSSIS